MLATKGFIFCIEFKTRNEIYRAFLLCIRPMSHWQSLNTVGEKHSNTCLLAAGSNSCCGWALSLVNFYSLLHMDKNLPTPSSLVASSTWHEWSSHLDSFQVHERIQVYRGHSLHPCSPQNHRWLYLNRKLKQIMIRHK